MAKTVRDAMTRNVRTATPAQSLADAAQMMKSEDAGAIPVVEDGRLVGIVTDRDIVVRVVAEGIDPKTLLVADVASSPVVAVTPGQDLDDALALMAQYQVRRLPVVEEDDEVVGILAQADVALNVKEKRAGETLEEISKPTTTNDAAWT
jgi:CBS domain-containing protein